mmetsp:Transcript_32227/g.102498  ORF Transcript_32227/g.102498 Transcript_32227/m.102498 type:complete len:1103 (-) Transcript_32227:77-3385(-)|eukprot:CAMPEP_0118860558 /NCGR_PEP_ID=MMETSP1163-20130328/6361_1 /TAXON_ID=124430 /ORGANISM="Phaeomonas parva, Strain CCMP2877" /LENGTH=1102 /DNA_ID=CAMNT_0006794263 /DNA_START=11 /DNA_END=3319 /DNA_ORIENTATION=-
MSSLEHNYDFTKGMIRRIKLENFLTYKDVEMYAGPRHNLVLGPNGTGKSSLLCAIGLGLGGRPKILGRADDLGTFILYGETTAFIEIALQDEQPGAVFFIKRAFERTSKHASKWYKRTGHVSELQRGFTPGQGWQSSSEKEIQAKVASLGIDVNNLTCFMPQERVGEFSGIKSGDLLTKTLEVLDSESSSISHQSLEAHKDLLVLEEEIAKLSQQDGSAVRELQQLRSEVDRLTREKERQDERRQLTERIALHDKLLKWMEFERLRVKGKAMQNEVKNVEERVAAEAARVAPLMDAQDQLQTQVQKCNSVKKKLDNKLARLRHSCKEKKKQLQKADTDILLEKSAIENIDKERQKNLQKIEEQKAKITDLDESIASIDEDAIKAEVQHVQARLDGVVEELRRKKDDEATLNERYETERENADRVKRRLAEAQSRVHRLVQKLQDRYGNRGRDAQRCHALIDQMRQENMFRGQVFGPVIAELAPRNDSFAKAIEDYLGGTAPLAFVVSHDVDYTAINRRLREKNIKSVTIARVHMDNRPPQIDAGKLEQMRAAGVETRGDEAFDAPPLVKQYLKAFNNIEKMIIGGAATEAGIDDFLRTWTQSLQQLVVYTVDDRGQMFKHSSSWSHQGETSMSTTQKVNPARILGAADSSVEDQLKDELAAVTGTVDALRKELAEKSAGSKALQTQKNEETARLRNLKHTLNKPKNLHAKKAAAEKLLAKLQEAVSRGVSEDRAAHVARITELCREAFDAMRGLQEDEQAIAAQTVPMLHSDVTYRLVEAQLTEVEEQLTEAKTAEQRIRADAAESKEKLKRIKKQCKELKKFLLENMPVTEIVPDPNNPGQEIQRDTALRAQISELEEVYNRDYDAATEGKEELQHKLETTTRDDEVYVQWEEATARLAERQLSVEQAAQLADAKREMLMQKQASHFNFIQGAVENISDGFQEYMADLGFEGLVQLGDAGPGGDSPVKQWKLLIQVKFRKEADLQTLSAHVHSGGERAVSTILFLMSLNKWVQSPFRIVDEINQGMDERNERLVMRRIIRNTTGAEGRQYFLITPKLLEGLADMEHEDVVVHVVFNGRKNVRSAEWDLGEFTAKRRRIAAA